MRERLRYWRCRRLRARVVDLAEGGLGPREKLALEKHVAQCAGCAEALSALRDLPAALRSAPAHDPGEAFWQRQRGEIMRAVGLSAGASRSREPGRPVVWRVGLAGAAVTAVVVGAAVLSYRPWPPAQAPAPKIAGPVESLHGESAATLVEIAEVLSLRDEMLEVWGAELDIGDFSDSELETLDFMVGDAPG